jgi:antitoxin VapB
MMQLNLKDPETNAMVTRLSEVTGLSKAGAVKAAVKAQLAEIEAARAADIARRVADVNRLVDEFRARLPTPLPTQAELDAWMYDDDGLPR